MMCVIPNSMTQILFYEDFTKALKEGSVKYPEIIELECGGKKTLYISCEVQKKELFSSETNKVYFRLPNDLELALKNYGINCRNSVKKNLKVLLALESTFVA